MSAEAALVALLRADAAVAVGLGVSAAAVETRIRPHSDAQNLASPYITYQRVSTSPIGKTFKAPAPFRSCTIQVDCWSDERAATSAPKDVAELAKAVRAALDDKGGVFNGEVISAIVFRDQRALPESTWQRMSLDFDFYEKG